MPIRNTTQAGYSVPTGGIPSGDLAQNRRFDSLDPEWGIPHNVYGVDCSVQLQAFLDAAKSASAARVRISAARYFVQRRILVPKDLKVEMDWPADAYATNGTTIQALNGFIGEDIFGFKNCSTDGVNYFWDGELSGGRLMGAMDGSTRYGIGTYDDQNRLVMLQDIHHIHDIQVWHMGAGGYYFNTGVPLNISRLRAMACFGPGVIIDGTMGAQNCVVTAQACSFDGNHGGGMHLKNLDDNYSVVIIGQKNERMDIGFYNFGTGYHRLINSKKRFPFVISATAGTSGTLPPGSYEYWIEPLDAGGNPGYGSYKKITVTDPTSNSITLNWTLPTGFQGVRIFGRINDQNLGLLTPTPILAGTSTFTDNGSVSPTTGQVPYNTVAKMRPMVSSLSTGGTLGAGDYKYWISAISLVPSVNNLSGASAGGGQLNVGSYTYWVSAIDSSGQESIASTVTASVSSGSSKVTLTWTKVTDDFGGYRIYGRSAGSLGLVGTVNSNTRLSAVSLTATIATFNYAGLSASDIGKYVYGEGIPQGATISDVSGNVVTLSSPSTVTGNRDLVLSPLAGTQISFTDTGSSFSSGYSPILRLETISESVSISVSTGTANRNVLTWDSVPWAETYEIYGRLPNGQRGLIGSTTNGTLTFTDTGSVSPDVSKTPLLYGGGDVHDQQKHPIVFENCPNLNISVIGLHSISAAKGANGRINAPSNVFGALYQGTIWSVIPSGSTVPNVQWSAVTVRYRTTEEINLPPSIITFTTAGGRLVDVPYSRSLGTIAKNGVSFPIMSNGDALRYVVGNSAYADAGAEDTGFQLRGNVPTLSLYQENATLGQRRWDFSIQSSKLNFSTRNESGTETTFLSFTRDATGVNSMKLRDGMSISFSTTLGSNIGTTTGEKIGFWGAVPVTRPAVTGSISSGAALSSLISALSTIGIISDSSSA